MDQVRTILRVIWQQRFWVLSGVGVIVAVVCWKMAAGAIDKQFADNKSTIESKFNAVDAIGKAPVWGNTSVNATEHEQAMIIRDKVVSLWETMYNNQRDKVLKWPTALGPDFLQFVENKRFRDPLTDAKVKNAMLERYRNYAKEAFPELVDIVQALKLPDPSGAGAAFEGASSVPPGMELDDNGNPVVPKYLVRWIDQGELRMQLDFPVLPTSQRVWVTQEDLWVYATLLHAIANTNEGRGATRDDNTAISEITELKVGQRAAPAFGTPGVLLIAAAPGAGEGGYGESRGGAEGMGPPAGYGDGGGMPVDGAAADPDAGLLAMRYVGDDGKPIPDEATAVDPTAQFRRLPVLMVLKMEQEAIPDLLIECANATLPIEVKRVRVAWEKSESGQNMTSGAMASGGGMGRDGYGGGYGRGGEGMGRPDGYSGGYGRGGEGMGRPGGYGGMSRDGGYGRGGGYGESSMAMMPGEGAPRPELVNVEIQGIVQIYNPPDPATMTVPGGPETVAAAGDAATVAR